MTKTDVLALGARGDHIPDLHRLIRDHHPVNEAFYQMPFLREARVRQSLMDTLTEVFHRGDQCGQFDVAIHTGFQLLGLAVQGSEPLLQLVPPLIFYQGHQAPQICLGQAVQLLIEADPALAELLPRCLQFLWQPVTALRPLQRLGHPLGMG